MNKAGVGFTIDIVPINSGMKGRQEANPLVGGTHTAFANPVRVIWNKSSLKIFIDPNVGKVDFSTNGHDIFHAMTTNMVKHFAAMPSSAARNPSVDSKFNIQAHNLGEHPKFSDFGDNEQIQYFREEEIGNFFKDIMAQHIARNEPIPAFSGEEMEKKWGQHGTEALKKAEQIAQIFNAILPKYLAASQKMRKTGTKIKQGIKNFARGVQHDLSMLGRIGADKTIRRG